MAHLHALLAAESPNAILIKRGPGKCSGTVGWDRATDTFQSGQWVRHLLHYDAADLSPDGRYFIHFADTHRPRKDFPVYLAISRAPWLKALTLWGSESWVQGPAAAFFFKDRDGSTKLWGWFPQPPNWDSLDFETVEELPESVPWRPIPGEGNYTVKLQRDGWHAGSPDKKHKENSAFEKPLLHGWTLRLARRNGSHREANRGTIYETFALAHPGIPERRERPWEWADWDAPRKRLVWTEEGQLFTAPLSADDLGPPRLLFDARPLKFEMVEAPY